MTAIDFVYDGIQLSSLGYIICQFDESGGFKTSSAGSNISFKTAAQDFGKYNILTGTSFDEPFEGEISFCKPDGARFTTHETSFLMAWLNRQSFHRLTVLDVGLKAIDYTGSFNLEKVEHRGKVIGYTAKFICKEPWGRGREVEEVLTITSAGGSDRMFNTSDNIGHVFPDKVIIECLDSGNLNISNSLEDRQTNILNCSSGEVITMDCANGIVESSDGTHALYNDFNFNFIRLARTLEDDLNVFTASLPCNITVIYRPIKKVVF